MINSTSDDVILWIHISLGFPVYGRNNNNKNMNSFVVDFHSNKNGYRERTIF